MTAEPHFSRLGSFQLENLVRNQIPFVYLYLSQGEKPQHPLFAAAKVIEAAAVRDYLKQQKSENSFPIVLVCSDGQKSTALARELASEGYLNVCVLEGGTQSL